MSSPTINRQELNMTKKKEPTDSKEQVTDDRMDETKKNIGQFDAYKIMDQDDLLVYYQSALRNIGLYTSVAFAIITYSRDMKGGAHIKLVTRFIGICILFIASSINFILLRDMQIVTNEGFTLFDKWSHINIILLIIQATLFLLSIYILFVNYA